MTVKPIDREVVVRIGSAINSDPFKHCTRDPLFVVQKKQRRYGFDADYCDESAWIDSEGNEVHGDEAKAMEASYEETGVEPDDFRRTGVCDAWEFVTLMFTQAAADEFIDRNRHRYGEMRVYVDSAYRNPEMIAVRNFLSALAKENP